MGINIRTIKDIKPYFADRLGELYPDTEITAIVSIIIRTIFNVSRLQAMSMADNQLSTRQSRELERICRELRSGKPLQYVIGETSFYNCTIRVDSSTLIPRPETEELVDLIIRDNKGKTPSVLDIATGSGCIAIALAVNLPGSEVTAFDLSPAAIAKAKENAALNKAQISFYIADIFDAALNTGSPVDIIVCNPPYVLESEKLVMAKNVLDFEPHTALFVPDDDPLRYYRAVLSFAINALKSDGRIWFEINERLGGVSAELMREYDYDDVQVIRDINGKDRILTGRKR